MLPSTSLIMFSSIFFYQILSNNFQPYLDHALANIFLFFLFMEAITFYSCIHYLIFLHRHYLKCFSFYGLHVLSASWFYFSLLYNNHLLVAVLFHYWRIVSNLILFTGSVMPMYCKGHLTGSIHVVAWNWNGKVNLYSRWMEVRGIPVEARKFLLR